MNNSTFAVVGGQRARDPIDVDVRHVAQIINYVFLSGFFGLLGVGTNIINILVFLKQGFKDSINISLMGLAISDLIGSLTMFCTSQFYNPILLNMHLSVEPLELSYITVEYPHMCFSRVTSVITAFITLERCLCIAMPLKVKTIITPFRTRVIIFCIFCFIIALFSPFYFVNTLEWKSNLYKNRSILGISFTDDREIVESVTFFIHGVFLSIALLLSVAICTIILVVKLNQKKKWREASVAQTASKQEEVSVKEKKVVKMITLISTIFIVCYFPSTVLFLLMVIYPEFSIGGTYESLLYVAWSGPYVLDAINSSVNIFVYFNMSTKYRVTLQKSVCEFNRTICFSQRK